MNVDVASSEARACPADRECTVVISRNNLTAFPAISENVRVHNNILQAHAT